jgi:Flp pilus assembly pilin Flp
MELNQPFKVNLADDTGANTAEYSIVTLAAVAFAGLLAAVLSSGTVQGLLEGLIERALSF